MSRTYRVQQFAALAGVTVKTLHHYDRLGLLRPLRTSSGYRVYSEPDLQRLAQISALKLVGVPLKRMKAILDGESRPLEAVLRSQRQVLVAKLTSLERAIEAIDEALRRQAAGDGGEVDIVRTLIEAIEMQNDVDLLKTYFEDESWARWRKDHPEWPGEEWHALLREIENALDDDPMGPRGKALAARWMALVEKDIGTEPAARRAFTRAWQDWTMRPLTRPHVLASYPMEAIFKFVVNGISAVLDDRRVASEVTRVPPRTTAARRQLFHDARELLGTAADSAEARALVDRLDRIFDTELGDNEELRSVMRTAWLRRPHWPEGVLRWVAMSYEMDPATWTAVADFLDAARVSASRD